MKLHEPWLYVEAMNRFAVPVIKGFCGSWEFVENAGLIECQNLRQYFIPCFKLFEADCKKFLRCIRNDFFEIDTFVSPLTAKASFNISNEKGLLLATCSQHLNGSDVKVIHVSKNPTVFNLSHAQANRLARLVTRLREKTPAKVGELSLTWTKSNSVGGYNGTGSIILHQHRKLDVHSNFFLPSIESFFLNYRKDLTESLKHIQREHSILDCFREKLTQSHTTSERCKQGCSTRYIGSHGNYYPSKKPFETGESIFHNIQGNKNTNVILNKSPPTTNCPDVPTSTLLTKEFILYLLLFMFDNIPEVSNLALSLSLNEVPYCGTLMSEKCNICLLLSVVLFWLRNSGKSTTSKNQHPCTSVLGSFLNIPSVFLCSAQWKGSWHPFTNEAYWYVAQEETSCFPNRSHKYRPTRLENDCLVVGAQ